MLHALIAVNFMRRILLNAQLPRKHQITTPPMSLLINHPDREKIVARLKTNIVLRSLKPRAFAELEKQLSVSDYRKGDVLISQGDHEMEQYFIIEGVLKRVVSNNQGKEMILRFSVEDDMDTSYAAWKLHTPAPYSIRAVTKARVGRLPLPAWAAFLERHPAHKAEFEYEVMHLMSEVMAHTITLHLLDAPGRVQRFLRKRPDLYDRVPKKELASYLNLSAETLSRLKHKGKIGVVD
jgi:CRP-like cAMP-binding protein